MLAVLLSVGLWLVNYVGLRVVAEQRRYHAVICVCELVATHVAGGPAYDPAHYAEAMAGKRWFGDAAGDIEAAAAANLGLLDSVGGSL